MIVEEPALSAAVERQWRLVEPDARRIAGELWAEPEVGLLERESAARLGTWLGKQGFEVTPSVGGLPTAFVGQSGKGPPTVGFIAEYDALPGLGNAAVPARAPILRGGPGHGCGHNLIAAANIAAAIAAANVRDELNLGGRIVVYGTPAEEILFGKVALLDAGVFAGCDVLLTHHPDYDNAALSRPCQSLIQLECAFAGRPAHTGIPRSGNGTDAAELLVELVARLRVHELPDVSIEHVIRYPVVQMPSATPEEARVWFYVRHVDYETAVDAFRFIAGQAEHAARAVGVTVTTAVVSSCRGYLPNDTLAHVLFEQLHRVGAPEWSAEDLARMNELCDALAPGSKPELDRTVHLRTDDYDRYAQDDGEVSWFVPVGRVNWAIPRQVPLHSWAATALFGMPFAWKGASVASRTLAATAATVLWHPDLVAEAQAERKRRAPVPVRSIRGAWQEVLAAPDEFWSGSWRMPAAAGSGLAGSGK